MFCTPTDELLRPGGLALTEHALAHCRLPFAARVLDLGCGAGQVGVWLRRHGLRALSLDRLAPPEPDGGAPRLVADAHTLPLPTAAFDAVLAECSLSVMAAPEQALAECARVLRPGGWLIVNDLYLRPAAERPLPGDAAWLKLDLAFQLRQLGLELEVWEDHTPALRAFAAEWYMAHGTLAPWLKCAGPAEQRRLGYFLAVARRQPMGDPRWTTVNVCVN